MIHFDHIEYLIALGAIPIMIVLYFLLIKWKKNTAKKIGDPGLVKELTAQYSPKKFALKFILFCTVFALCVFAVAGLKKPDGTQKINRKGTDIMIALDVSKSMLAQDIKPNRLERAKQLISKIIDYSPDDRIGLVVFAGHAYLQMPLTFDQGAAKMYLSGASPDDVPTQGTVISEALKMSAAAFNPKEKTFKSILLISDGEDHDDEALKTTKKLAEQGIMINTIGIGSPLGAPIMDEETGQYKVNQEGQTVITKLNEQELSNIAQAGNGIYQLYSNSDNVAKNFKNQLSGIGKETNLSDSSFDSFKQYFQYFLGAALLLLILEFFITEKRKLKINSTVLFLLLMFGISPAFSQNNPSISKGNKAFKENKLDDAENYYRDALKKSDKEVNASYNLGNVLYRKEKPEEAAKSYDNTIANTNDNVLKQNAYYNKGVAFQKAKKLPESILSYKNALLLNPDDEDARQNLQRAMTQQKQEQQQQQDKKQDNKDQKNKQNKDQQNKDQQNKDQQKNKEPKPQPSRMSKQNAEEKLKSLNQKEKALQDKIRKIKGASPDKPDKDW
ncbi:MAG: VWA domain-containing protein [Ginsengibacter sp.]